MAVSIKREGVINPIEVDENFIIITGELRWRAAQMAGLTEVPVKILGNLSAKDRYIRQVNENLHQNTMSAYDTAVALDKILKTIPASAAVAKKGSGGFSHGKRGVKEMHDLLGISETSISEFLDLLTVEGELKEALKDPAFQRTKIATIKEAPKKYQKSLEKIVAVQKNIPRDTVRHIVKGLRRAEKYSEDGKAEQLLKESFEGLSVAEAAAKVSKIIPDEIVRTKEPADLVKLISERVLGVTELLDAHPLKSIDDFHQERIINELMMLGACLKRYFKGTGNNMDLTQEALFDDK